jgi:hypothetical protein
MTDAQWSEYLRANNAVEIPKEEYELAARAGHAKIAPNRRARRAAAADERAKKREATRKLKSSKTLARVQSALAKYNHSVSVEGGQMVVRGNADDNGEEPSQ